jgi:hypothetical protein
VRISPDRAVLHNGFACISGPLNTIDSAALQELLRQQYAVERVERRLQIFKRSSLFVCFSFLFGVVIGTIVAAPILIGGKPYTEPMPWLSTALGIIGTGLFVVFGSLPHVHLWNALKEPAASTKC